jgi:RND family efflux transporter MFP subunit
LTLRPLSALPYLMLGLAVSASAQTLKPVSVSPLSEIASYPQRSAPATVISLNQPQISAEISARLESFPALVGDRVTQGDVLARLDCRELEFGLDSARAQVASTEARLALANSRLNRAQTLNSNQLLSQDDLDSSRTELSALQASLQIAEAQLASAQLGVDRCSIEAPFDGLVLERHAQTGQWMSPGMPVVTLQDLSRIEISAQIFTADALLIDSDTVFELEANGQRTPVSLRSLVDSIDPTTRNREARFIFFEGSTLVGAAGKIVWNDPRPHLPPELLVERNGQLGIFIVKDNRAEFFSVTGAQPGRSNPASLPPDTMVVTDGYLGLVVGDSVSIRAP